MFLRVTVPVWTVYLSVTVPVWTVYLSVSKSYCASMDSVFECF